MMWKDYKITIWWLKDQIKKDIKGMFSSASSPSTYTNIVMDYFKAIKSIFTSPTYGLYWAATLFVFSWVVHLNILWNVFFGILVIFAYLHLKLKSGEPVKEYKRRFYGQ